MSAADRSEFDRMLDERADAAIGSVRPDDPAVPTPTRENAPMAWDLVRFWIWIDPVSGDDEEIAIRAMEYTGE